MAEDAQSDAELLARRRDPEAFRVVYQRHVRSVYVFALARTARADVAADLTAETFAQAWRGRRRFDDQAAGSALPWLLGITRRLALAYHRSAHLEQRALRRLGLERSLDAPDPADGLAARVASDELRLVVERNLGQLSAEQREVVQLRVLEGLSYREVAARVGCDPAAARMRASRALRLLRARLTEGEA